MGEMLLSLEGRLNLGILANNAQEMFLILSSFVGSSRNELWFRFGEFRSGYGYRRVSEADWHGERELYFFYKKIHECRALSAVCQAFS